MIKLPNLIVLLISASAAQSVQIDNFVLNPDPNTPLTAGGSYFMEFSGALVPGSFFWPRDLDNEIFYSAGLTVTDSTAHAQFSHQEGANEAGEFDFNVITGDVIHIIAYRAGGPELEIIPCNPHLEYDPQTGSGTLSWLAANPPQPQVPDMAWTPALMFLGLVSLWRLRK